ncbi:hypothetical protein EUGRSUZ_I01208 [Eucalyptus grandis]|uniref:Uncharacterized protein n=2 Tax=Eucalyptus grandis TaxID=71139 RepID=A0ACC3JEF4_EUCGR|nr:hypothetical protein EUGRSUZ_I01208 [Eucalyptus grandis]
MPHQLPPPKITTQSTNEREEESKGNRAASKFCHSSQETLPTRHQMLVHIDILAKPFSLLSHNRLHKPHRSPNIQHLSTQNGEAILCC